MKVSMYVDDLLVNVSDDCQMAGVALILLRTLSPSLLPSNGLNGS